MENKSTLTDISDSHILAQLEEALTQLQCVLVSRRLRYHPASITWVQYDVLECLRLNGEVTPSVMGEQLGLSRSKLSKTLRVLKDLELVEQKKSLTDKREQHTTLTEKGQQFLDQLTNIRHEMAQKVATNMSVGEQAIFAELGFKVCSALRVISGEDESND